MARLQKSTETFSHPFCKGYWRAAAAELKDTKMLVFAALIVALRVALKTAVRIPLGPSLDITPAFLANALGAMVYGPVVGAIGALVSDVLGVLLRGDTYFLPYALTEIAGSMIFAMYFYRQKITPTRVILSRFTICLCVNILLQTPIDMLFQYVTYGKSSVVITLPRIFKNLFMFPIESAVLSVFLGAVQPITYRMKLTHVKAEKLSFNKKQIALLVCLVIVGALSVFGYLFVHYDNTSLSAGYSVEERIAANKSMQPIFMDHLDEYYAMPKNEDTTVIVIPIIPEDKLPKEELVLDGWPPLTYVTIVESAYKKFLGDEITYTVAVYTTEAETVGDDIWKLSKSKAASNETLTRVATATILINEDTGEVLDFQIAPAE